LKLKEISNEKEEIEKLKKNRNKTKALKKSTTLPAVPMDGFSGNNNKSISGGAGLMQMNECSEFDLEESEFNNIDKNE
jgi:hypothetical protein